MVSLDGSKLLFMPPKNILEMMKKDLNVICPSWKLFQRTSKLEFERYIDKHVMELIGSIIGFYKLDIEKVATSSFNTPIFIGVFVDGMRNALEHGPQDFPLINYGLFFGDKAICHGFQDFGDYFKSPETKRQWESMEHINTSKAEGPRNVGTSVILRSQGVVDYFEVDNNQGALFCMQNLETLCIEPDKRFYGKYNESYEEYDIQNY